MLKQKIYQKELQSLQQQVNTNRIFLDMVVHDMRNPTSSIEFGLQETLKILDKHFENYTNLKNTFMEWKAQEEMEQNSLQIEE